MRSATKQAALDRFFSRVKPCPAAGDGVHQWLLHAAERALEAGLSDEQALDAVEALMRHSPNQDNEVEDGLAIFALATGPDGGMRPVLIPVAELDRLIRGGRS